MAEWIMRATPKCPPANAGALLPSWAAYSTLACLSRQKLIDGIESMAGENRVRMALDLSRPFTNMICVGKVRDAVALDLLETWALLQGYWQRSRRVVLEGGKRYLCLETVCDCLVILRDITEPEDDSAALNAIADLYTHENGSLRIHRLEVNHWADLRRVTLPCALIAATDFDRCAAWA